MIKFVSIDNGVYSRFLGTCQLPNTLILEANSVPPARRFNDIIRQSMEQYIVFIHADTTQKGLLYGINKTISVYPNFGALGAVGAMNRIVWASEKMSYPVVTLDSCLLVINKENNIYFDEKNFNSFHGFVEDYCARAKGEGLEVRTILINGYEAPNNNWKPERGAYFIHHSNMVRKHGGAWGDFKKYYRILKAKYPNIQTTSDY